MGRVDVDEMLSEISPKQFDEWIAFSAVEPFGNDWLQTGTIASSVDNGFASIIAGLSGSPPTFTKATDYVPRIATEQKKRPNIRIDLEGIDRIAQQFERQADKWQSSEA